MIAAREVKTIDGVHLSITLRSYHARFVDSRVSDDLDHSRGCICYIAYVRLSTSSWVLLLGLLYACSSEAQSVGRCALCGMRVDPSGLVAGATGVDGASLAFDSAKCLFRYRFEHESARDAWVSDYYSRGHLSIDAAFFVLGSDVSGAMGADLIALSRAEDAERFSREHHGTAVLRLPDVTRAVIDALFGR